MEAKKTVLIVDDSEDTRNAILEYLVPIDCSVLTAKDGAEAWHVINNRAVDLILSDVRMQPMDGLEFLTSLRETGLTIPIILMTSFANVEIVARAWQLGAYDFLEKPFEEEPLRRMVSAALNNGKEFVIRHPAGSRGTFQRLTMEFPHPLYAKLREEALKHGLSLTTYLARLAETSLTKVDPKAAKAS